MCQILANQKEGEKQRLNRRNIVVTPYFLRHRYIVYCQFVKICNKNLVIEIFISPCSGLFLERAREPEALYFAVGLSLFAGGLSLIR